MKGIVIMAPLRTIPGKGAELEKLFKQLVPMVKKEKGTLEYVLYRQEDDSDRFVVFEKYVDKEALKYHSSTDYFKEFGKKSAPLLVGPVDLNKIRFFLPVE
jgi:quinol monooxygenase YgiN